MGRIIENIEVVDVEKRKIPSKHYVYIVHVEWSDQCTNVIYRRYSRFFDFQSQLMDMYPEEAGAMDPSKRIIPFLPGKKFFGRSHIREVALKRMGPIAEYCKQIVKLPRKISQCKEVLEFFELEPDDIDPPKGRRQSLKAKKISQPKQLEVYIAVTEYKKQEKGEVTLQVGMLVEIVEKTETGWWFVNVEDEQGWVPSTCLEREDGVKEDTTVKFAPGQEEQYLCTDEFKGETEDELSMEKGAVVDVLEKNLEGWWRVRYNGREGLVPATYLIKTNSVKIRKNKTDSSIPSPRSNGVPVDSGPVIVKSLIDVSDLLKDDSGNTLPQSSVPKITTSSYVDVDIDNNDDDDDDDDDVDDAFDEDNYDVPEDDKMYTIQELSKILKEDKQGEKETQKIYESLQSMKSRSLKRNGSTRPPPRPSVKPSQGSSPVKVSRPPLVRAESSYMEYVTIAAFSDVVGDGISFDGGESVKVLEKSETGWWYIEIDGNEGWAPATYIEKVTPAVDKPRAPSPQTQRAPSPQPLSTVKKTHSPARSQEDLADDSGMGNKRNSSFGNLTNALKAKFKTNKSPPTLPKKDFLDDHDDVEDTAPVSPKTPKSPKSPKHPHIQHSFPAQSGPAVHGVKPGFKKAADRSMQPPPPAPPGKLSAHSADVSKPDVVNKPMPPVPPAKVGLKPPPADAKPKPPSKPTSDTVKDNSSDDDSKPSPFNIVLKPTGGPHKVDSKPENKPKPNLKPLVPTKKDTKPANVALKPSVPVKQDVKPADLKPKPPVKNKPHETADEAIGKVDVAGLAGALKAKFESGNVMNSANDVERPKSGISHKQTVKANFNKPDTSSKPSLVPKPGQDKPVKPSWVKHSEPSAPEPTTKPSFVRSTADKSPSRESGSSGETRKVSALADALKAKLEIKGHSEPAFDHVASRASHPVPQFNKSPTKQFEKPVRPSTPPTQRPSRPNMSPGSRANPRSKGSNLDPTKYSSRPLPPAPGKAPSNPQSKKALPQVPKKSKPVVPDPESDSSDSDDDARPSGVSNLANVLKARLGVQQTSDQTKHNNTPSVSMKPKINTKAEPDVKKSSNKYDIENNNTEEVKTEGTYCAIADYPGTNEGEIKLVAGQYFNLLETADGWWYVSSGNDEGWAPSTYLEKVSSDGSVEPAADTEEQGGSSGTDSQNSLCLVSSDFDAENEGELSVKQGEHVEVLESPEGGWWYVKARGNEGWVPASFLS